MQLRADDRVLLLAIPAKAELALLARVLSNGVLVAIGTREEVDTAREWMAEFDNTMFVEADPQQIPWRDAYFTKIVVPPQMEFAVRSAASELNRLLAPNGEIIRNKVNV